MKQGCPLDPEKISSREDFAGFVDRLRNDLSATPGEWQNRNLENYLEALSAYARDVPGFIRNVGSAVDSEQASWQLFALLLLGARVYE
jgi:hypothetical protein